MREYRLHADVQHRLQAGRYRLVWTAVSRKQPGAKAEISRPRSVQRVTIGVTQAKGAKQRAEGSRRPARRQAGGDVRALAPSAGGGTALRLDCAAFAPTADVTIQMIGQQKTLGCLLPQAVLHQLR